MKFLQLSKATQWYEKYIQTPFQRSRKINHFEEQENFSSFLSSFSCQNFNCLCYILQTNNGYFFVKVGAMEKFRGPEKMYDALSCLFIYLFIFMKGCIASTKITVFIFKKPFKQDAFLFQHLYYICSRNFKIFFRNCVQV